jgi:ATP-dependent Clp protease adaptor protein ClpS
MSGQEKTGDAVKERAEVKQREPTLYNVVLLNDDYTTMDFVIQVLETVFERSPSEAYRIMLHVHQNGRDRRQLSLGSGRDKGR